MKKVFTAKTIEEAKRIACEAFGVSEDYIVFRILEEPKKSLFGKVKREAQVEATYEMLEEIQAESAKKTAAKKSSASAKKPIAPALAKKPAEPAEKPAAPTTKPAEPEAKVAAPTPKPAELEAKPTAQRPTPDRIVTEDNGTHSIELEEVERVLEGDDLSPALAKAKQYVTDIYEGMGISVQVCVLQTKSGIRMEISSSYKSGTIIGRRGEMLDSIQYLASIVVNKESEEYCRLLLDSNGYREKRRKTLEQLAQKIARNVQRSGRSTTLEPMNPYVRRIIHSQIAKIEGVTSRSVGEDPYRKVIISPVGGYRGGHRGGSGKGNDGNRQQRPYRDRNRNPEDFSRKDMDLMKTNFERDYKKPRPEDNLNIGLYGKIEI